MRIMLQQRLLSLSGTVQPWMMVLAIFCVVVLLYGQFLRNPLVFDDVNFFDGKAHPQYLDLSHFFSLTPRWLGYATFEWTRLLLGDDIVWHRLGNLLLHLAVAAMLFAFLHRLFSSVLSGDETGKRADGGLTPAWLAFFGALLFALHPAAVYGAAYLIQRTILMATLFSIAMWYFFLCGILQNRRGLLLASVLAYALALLSKEHAVMAPSVSFALLLLAGKPGQWRRIWPVFLLYGALAAYTAFAVKSGLLARPYEPNGPAMIARLAAKEAGFDEELAWPLSIATQSWLYFKYLWVWCFPGPAWMSVDMHERFAIRLLSWPYTLGLAGFAVYPLLAAWLLRQRGARGLFGFAMLCPWLMFLTELSTVRISETFVLYRSYLWMPVSLAMLPLLCRHTPARRSAALLILLALVLTPVTWERLTTFSSGLRLWNDAARLIRNKQDWPGVERIYHNRGLQFTLLGWPDQAIQDYNRALALNPKHALAYNDRGATYLGLGDYSQAVADFSKALDLGYQQARLGRAIAYEASRQIAPAMSDYRRLCELGNAHGCQKIGIHPAGSH